MVTMYVWVNILILSPLRRKGGGRGEEEEEERSSKVKVGQISMSFINTEKKSL